MSLIQYLCIQICAFIGLFIGSLILPTYDDFIYPFAPNFSFLLQFYQIIFPLGVISMFMALLAAWVYKKTMSFAAISSVVAMLIEYKLKLFSNLSEHYFHFSFVLVYLLGVYFSYWFVKYSLTRFGAKNT